MTNLIPVITVAAAGQAGGFKGSVLAHIASSWDKAVDWIKAENPWSDEPYHWRCQEEYIDHPNNTLPLGEVRIYNVQGVLTYQETVDKETGDTLVLMNSPELGIELAVSGFHLSENDTETDNDIKNDFGWI